MNIQENPNYFANNLNLIRDFNRWSMAEFAEETCVPKSTLQTVLTTGQSSLDTALRIARKLGIPLDILTGTVLSPSELEAAHHIFRTLDWFSHLPCDDQQEAFRCLQSLLSLIQRGGKNEARA